MELVEKNVVLREGVVVLKIVVPSFCFPNNVSLRHGIVGIHVRRFILLITVSIVQKLLGREKSPDAVGRADGEPLMLEHFNQFFNERPVFLQVGVFPYHVRYLAPTVSCERMRW
ncbi:MAG: hypothetical protein A3C56_10540 [Ignavibacteria bacterium RIFCSPHIGHO2_02_FULL_56_12]|nr:MAG: hypothetical protein A3C56_10540 [Ignavibacteria bacterium RIFCSPHIGHO2_02_FULL_56_12]